MSHGENRKLYVIIKDVFGDSMPSRDWFLQLMRINGVTQKKKKHFLFDILLKSIWIDIRDDCSTHETNY